MHHKVQDKQANCCEREHGGETNATFLQLFKQCTAVMFVESDDPEKGLQLPLARPDRVLLYFLLGSELGTPVHFLLLLIGFRSINLLAWAVGSVVWCDCSDERPTWMDPVKRP